MRQQRLVTSVILIIGLLLSPVHQALACAMEAAESAGGDMIHAVDTAGVADAAGTDDAAPHNSRNPCSHACNSALTAERVIHIPAGIPSIDEAGHRLLDPPLFRRLRPPRPASV